MSFFLLLTWNPQRGRTVDNTNTPMPENTLKIFSAGFDWRRGIANIRRRNEAPPKKRKKTKMKTRSLLLGAAVFAAITINARATDVLLSPRAAGNQNQHFAGTYNDPNLVNPTGIAASPRAMSNQIKTVAGTNNDVNSVTACAAGMKGSPKQVAECTSHTTMPLCNPATVEATK
jgi:hypothetical protein